MSTINFCSQKLCGVDIPLVCVGDNDVAPFSEYLDALESLEESIDTYTYENYVEYGYEFVIEETKNILDRINEQLEYFEIVIKSGYFEGLQLYVKENNDWCDDEEDIRYEELLTIPDILINFTKDYGIRSSK